MNIHEGLGRLKDEVQSPLNYDHGHHHHHARIYRPRNNPGTKKAALNLNDKYCRGKPSTWGAQSQDEGKACQKIAGRLITLRHHPLHRPSAAEEEEA